jgi:hypothetical protein
LVFTIRWRIGVFFAMSRMAKKSGWMVGSPPEIWTTSGSPSLRTTASNIFWTVARSRNSGRCTPLSA